MAAVSVLLTQERYGFKVLDIVDTLMVVYSWKHRLLLPPLDHHCFSPTFFILYIQSSCFGQSSTESIKPFHLVKSATSNSVTSSPLQPPLSSSQKIAPLSFHPSQSAYLFKQNSFYRSLSYVSTIQRPVSPICFNHLPSFTTRFLWLQASRSLFSQT